jgi:radical SAM protein with 4Fe4S-binding SPASM domain
MIPQVREGIQIRKEEWGAIVIDRWFEEILELDQAGLDILEEINGIASPHNICDAISGKWQIDSEEATNTVILFLRELENNGIIYDTNDKKKLKVMEDLKNTTHSFKGFTKGTTLQQQEPSLIHIYKPLRAPILVTLDVTARCNLKCRYCYVRAGEDVSNELSTQQIKDIIDELQELGVFWISISGGEPLIREDICEITQYCVEKGFSTSITTNGTLLTEELASNLKETGLERVQISIDSIDPYPHETMRGKGTHARTLEGLNHLKEAGFSYIGISCVPTKLNLKDIPNLIDWAHAQHVPLVRILRYMPAGRGGEVTSITLDRQEIQWLMETVKKKQEELKEKLIIRITDAFKAVVAEKPLYTCNAAKTWCAIDSQGYVLPCTLMINPEAVSTLHPQNILEEGLQSIWLNSTLLEKQRNPSFLEGKCSHCPELDSCQGGCRAYAFAVTGDIHAPDPICRMDVSS